jgi:hypothetical protein
MLSKVIGVERTALPARPTFWRVMTICALAIVVPASSAGQTPVQLLTEVACPECRITLTPVVTLGDEDGPGMLLTEHNLVTRDSRGRYFVSAVVAPYVWVFDAAGEFIRRIGQRGPGPGEFQGISPLLIGPQDSLYIFDSRQGRMSVFSPDFDLVRTASLGFGRGSHGGAVLGDRIVVNADIRTSERVGYPLHLLDPTGEIVRSFGSETGVYRPDLREIIHQRTVAGAGGEAVWSGWLNQYVIERWDTSGRITRRLRRDVEWFEPWWSPETDIETPPQPVMRAVSQHGDTLWVLIVVPDRDWRSAVRPRPDGRFFIVDDINAYYDSVIEAIDLRGGKVIASTRIPRMLQGFAGRGLVYGHGTDAIGNPLVPIWELNIVHPAQDQRRR